MPALSLNYLFIFTAEARGFFKDEGLQNETLAIAGPSPIAARVSSDVDFNGAASSRLLHRHQGRAIGAGSTNSPMPASEQLPKRTRNKEREK